MRILSIGNSFSQDAHRYLHDLALGEGREAECVNLYIGGCSLERHWENVSQDLPAYAMELNGQSAEAEGVSARETVEAGGWDVITLQQVSYLSGFYDTYQPYLDHLSRWIRETNPGAKLMIQQTWAYEIDSLHPQFVRYHQDQGEMYAALKRAYADAAEANGLELIPCGDVIQALRSRAPFLYDHGGMSLCRDGFHMNLIYGRYLLSAVWYKTITGRPVSGIPFIPATPLAPHAVCDKAVLSVVRKAVDELA